MLPMRSPGTCSSAGTVAKSSAITGHASSGLATYTSRMGVTSPEDDAAQREGVVASAVEVIALAEVEALGLKPEAKRKFLRENALRVYKLKG